MNFPEDRQPESGTRILLSAESPHQLYDILESTNGQLVVDAYATFENKRPFYRVTPAGVKMALVTDTPGESYSVETRDVNKRDLLEVIKLADDLKIWPYHDSPFTAADPES